MKIHEIISIAIIAIILLSNIIILIVLFKTKHLSKNNNSNDATQIISNIEQINTKMNDLKNICEYLKEANNSFQISLIRINNEYNEKKLCAGINSLHCSLCYSCCHIFS